MRLALRYSVVVGMNMQIFGVYVCSNESILSITLDSEGKIFFSDSTFSVSIWRASAFTFFPVFPWGSHFGFIQVNVNKEMNSSSVDCHCALANFQCLHLFWWIDLQHRSHWTPYEIYFRSFSFSFLLYPKPFTHGLESLKLIERFLSCIAAREMKSFARLYVNSVFTAWSYRLRLTPDGNLSRRAKRASEVN